MLPMNWIRDAEGRLAAAWADTDETRRLEAYVPVADAPPVGAPAVRRTHPTLSLLMTTLPLAVRGGGA